MTKSYKSDRNKEKLDEITRLKEESLSGEYVRWSDLKKELSESFKKEGTMLDYETDVLEATAKLGYNKGEILHNALKMYLDANKELKEKLAVELYKEGKVSLGKANEVADVSYEEMKELLAKNKVRIRRGPVSLKELKKRAEELAEIL